MVLSTPLICLSWVSVLWSQSGCFFRQEQSSLPSRVWVKGSKSSILLLFLRFVRCFCRTAVALPAPTLGWHSSGEFGIADAQSLDVRTFLSPRINRSNLRDAQIVSLPPIYMVTFSEGRCFSAPKKVKEETTVRRKLFLSFPQTGNNMDFCVGRVRLRDGSRNGTATSKRPVAGAGKGRHWNK